MSKMDKSKLLSRSVSQVINQTGSQFGQLLAQAKVLDHLNQILQKALDPALGKLAKCTSINEGQLTLVTPSAALANRLRMETPAILAALADSSVAGISSIHVVIGPLPREIEPHQPRRKLRDRN